MNNDIRNMVMVVEVGRTTAKVVVMVDVWHNSCPS